MHPLFGLAFKEDPGGQSAAIPRSSLLQHLQFRRVETRTPAEFGAFVIKSFAVLKASLKPSTLYFQGDLEFPSAEEAESERGERGPRGPIAATCRCGRTVRCVERGVRAGISRTDRRRAASPAGLNEPRRMRLGMNLLLTQSA